MPIGMSNAALWLLRAVMVRSSLPLGAYARTSLSVGTVTQIVPFASTATLGSENALLCQPGTLKLETNVPSRLNTCNRALPLSHTYTWPDASVQITIGSANCP